MKTIASIAAALTFAACAAYAAEPADNYAKLCASCHGKDGAGHTKAGKKLEIKDLTDGAYQKTFTDAQAFDSLKTGLKSKEGDDRMKSFAEKLSDDEIKGLVTYVRTLAK
jgi:mono/diheme cytochrome c family protein